jgi:heptosyltransferase-2
VRPLDARLDQTVKRFVALGLEPPDEAPDVLPSELRPRLVGDDANLARLRAELGLGERDRVVTLMPGAEYGPAKRWPAASFAELARVLEREGAHVLVLGSAKERALGDEIVAGAASDRVRNLCGTTSLADVVDLVGAARAAVSNDSGLMHVAAATRTPVIAIYGSSSPNFTPPLSAAATVIYRGIECSPCFARECPLGHLRCLREITPAAVLEAVRAASADELPSEAR